LYINTFDSVALHNFRLEKVACGKDDVEKKWSSPYR